MWIHSLAPISLLFSGYIALFFVCAHDDTHSCSWCIQRQTFYHFIWNIIEIIWVTLLKTVLYVFDYLVHIHTPPHKSWCLTGDKSRFSFHRKWLYTRICVWMHAIQRKWMKMCGMCGAHLPRHFIYININNDDDVLVETSERICWMYSYVYIFARSNSVHILAPLCNMWLSSTIISVYKLYHNLDILYVHQVTLQFLVSAEIRCGCKSKSRWLPRCDENRNQIERQLSDDCWLLPLHVLYSYNCNAARSFKIYCILAAIVIRCAAPVVSSSVHDQNRHGSRHYGLSNDCCMSAGRGINSSRTHRPTGAETTTTTKKQA